MIEHLSDPEIKPPDDLNSEDEKNKTSWFKCTEEFKRHVDKKESLEFGKKKSCSLIWGQCTQ